MEIIITDLLENQIDKFINQDTDVYGKVIRSATENNHTVDLVVKVKTFAVDSNHMILEYPNTNVVAISISSCMYHKIEVI